MATIRKLLCKDFFAGDERIHAGFYLEQRKKSMHLHEFWELSYVFEGNGTHYTCNDGIERSREIRTGDFVFMPPDVAHCMTSPAKTDGGVLRTCNLLIAPNYMAQLIAAVAAAHEFDEYALRGSLVRREPFCAQLADDSGSVYRLMLAAAHEYLHFCDGSADIIDHCLRSLLVYIVRLYERAFKKERVANTKDDAIDRVLRVIQTNFGGNLSLAFLSEHVHLSPEYLCRSFKKRTGKHLSAFIAETRIEKAKYRLRTTTWNIAAISDYCGYQSTSSFQKAFKKAVGMSAREYREKSAGIESEKMALP